MTLEDTLHARLTGFAPVQALVDTRVYPLIAPQGAPAPYIVYARAAASPLAHLRGGNGMASARIAIDAYADSYAALRQIVRAVKKCLDGYGTRGVLQSSRMESEVEGINPDLNLHQCQMTFVILYTEQTP